MYRWSFATSSGAFSAASPASLSSSFNLRIVLSNNSSAVIRSSSSSSYFKQLMMQTAKSFENSAALHFLIKSASYFGFTVCREGHGSPVYKPPTSIIRSLLTMPTSKISIRLGPAHSPSSSGNFANPKSPPQFLRLWSVRPYFLPGNHHKDVPVM